jgi:hypothetical protein
MSYFKLDIERFKQRSDKNFRTQFLGLAHLAEMSYRFDDMCLFMREVVLAAADGPDLTHDERNLLSVAYKNAVGARRAAWRAISIDDQYPASATMAFAQKIEDELQALCSGILDLLERILIKHPLCTEDAMVFYRKMAGDYYRYLAEFSLEEDLSLYQDKSSQYYREAMEIAVKIMTPSDPIRLGLALNYSVCLYEIMKRREEACALAKRAYDEALLIMNDSDQHQYKDAKLILNLLRDNLSLWNQSSPAPHLNDSPNRERER